MKRLATARSGDWSALDAYLSDLSDVSQFPVLSDADASALGEIACEGNVDAQEQLVKSHLRLVVKIAHQYTGFGLPLADLISEGNLGLIRAAELYNPKFGTRFITYSSVWIKQRIHRAITSQARAIRIPVWRSQRLRKLVRIHEDLSTQLGRSASQEELADRLGLSPEELADLQGDRVEVVSIDAPTNAANDSNEEYSRSIGDLIPDEATPHPSSRIKAEEVHDELLACLSELDDRELQVLSHKFGLKVEEPLSFRELGRRMGVSHEWVRRIAELALVKVRRAFEDAERWTHSEREERYSKTLLRVNAITAGQLAPAK
ncbi:MAG: RNA polymerase sigma factor RpoD/SigA [Verrucomicrobiota bacterium]